MILFYIISVLFILETLAGLFFLVFSEHHHDKDQDSWWLLQWGRWSFLVRRKR